MFAVAVTIALHKGMTPAFIPLMRTNAAASLRDEPGCHRFDVCTDPARHDTVFLYELYDDAAAFARHMETPHFLSFDRETRDMIRDKTVMTFAEVNG